MDHADCSNLSVRAGRSFAEFLVGYLSRNGSEVAGIIPAKDKKMIAWLIPKYNTNFIPGNRCEEVVMGKLARSRCGKMAVRGCEGKYRGLRREV